jgi:MOSC domain-containing protein YiiM
VSDGRILSVNVAVMRLIMINGEPVKTGIYKLPAEGRLEVAEDGLVDDQQADLRVHGGPDKAVYAYGTEDLAWWEEELGREMEPGLLGENLTVEGLDPSQAKVGERWRAGSTLLEVSEPRLPCAKVAVKMGDPRFVRRFAKALRPGAYLRVIEPGDLGAGDEVELVARPEHAVTMEKLARIAFGERELIEEALGAEALSSGWREWLGERAAAAG